MARGGRGTHTPRRPTAEGLPSPCVGEGHTQRFEEPGDALRLACRVALCDNVVHVTLSVEVRMLCLAWSWWLLLALGLLALGGVLTACTWVFVTQDVFTRSPDFRRQSPPP
jgi:hypothetical protein